MKAGRPRVAVVGAGVAGLTAAHVLHRSHEVTLFEADDRLGGHAHTHDVDTAGGLRLAVDSGFIVHNDRTYPTLTRLFDELGVATRPTGMSLSVRCDGCGLEYSGGQGPGGLLAQGRSVLRPRFGRMLLEVKRFHRGAATLLAQPGESDLTTAEFLRQGRYSEYFGRHFLTPLIAAVWSCGPGTARRYPARYLFAFLDHHGMLAIGGSPRWRTVVGGSRTYVRRIERELPDVRTGTPVRSLTRSGGGVRVRDSADRVSAFDAAVVATHPDQALALLADPTPAEKAVLGAFDYSPNPVVLHTDPVVLPVSERARAAWNYRMDHCASDARDVRITYDLTRLQGLDVPERYLVSLHLGEGEVDPGRVLARAEYAHPQYTPASVAAQAGLPGLNDSVTAFAGAYHGWGFHEDGARSGLAAALALGGRW
jgi:uncharacterized protein